MNNINTWTHKVVSCAILAAVMTEGRAASGLQIAGRPIQIVARANVYATRADVIFFNGNWYISSQSGGYAMMPRLWSPELAQLGAGGGGGIAQIPLRGANIPAAVAQLHFRISVDRVSPYYLFVTRAVVNGLYTLSTGPLDVNNFSAAAEIGAGSANIGDVGFDCDSRRCTISGAGNTNGNQFVFDRSNAGGQMVQQAASGGIIPSVAALQVDLTSHIIFTDPNRFSAGVASPSWADWIAPAIPVLTSTLFYPSSIVAARIHGRLITYLSDAVANSVTVYRFEPGAAAIPAVRSNSTGIRWTDSDSRGDRMVMCGIGSPVGGGARVYVIGEHSGAVGAGNQFTELMFSQPAVPGAEPGPCRVALERGPGHLGRGLMVYEKEVPGLPQREIWAQPLSCHDPVDCDDEDPQTVDQCNLGVTPSVCIHTRIGGVDAGPEGGMSDAWGPNDSSTGRESGVADGFSMVDVPSDQPMAMSDAIATEDIPDPSMDVQRIPLDEAALPALDAMVARDSATPADGNDPRGLAFSGGSCGCAVPSREKASDFRVFLLFAVAVALARRRVKRTS